MGYFRKNERNESNIINHDGGQDVKFVTIKMTDPAGWLFNKKPALAIDRQVWNYVICKRNR